MSRLQPVLFGEVGAVKMKSALPVFVIIEPVYLLVLGIDVLLLLLVQRKYLCIFHSFCSVDDVAQQCCFCGELLFVCSIMLKLLTNLLNVPFICSFNSMVNLNW